MRAMRIPGLLACVLLLAGAANAGEVTILHTVDYTYNRFPSEPWPGYYFWHESLEPFIDHPPYFRFMWQDWGWTHDLAALAPADATGVQRGVLSIQAWGVDEVDHIHVHNGTSWEYVGQLQGWIAQWSTTSFELPATCLEQLFRSGKLDVFMDVDYEEEGGRVTLSASTVEVTYTVQGTPPVDPQTPTGGVLDTIYVDDAPYDPNAGQPQENGTPEHPFRRIQLAIEAARPGARIVVRPGTYFETINLLGKSIEVTGLDDGDPNDIAALPVIDGGGKDTVVRCARGEDPNCILRGLVITGGKGRLGGGILCLGASPTIRNCLIVGNRATDLGAGGGIHCQDSNAVLVNCTISGNCGGSGGAGVGLSQSDATILDSIVWENAPVQIVVTGTSHSVVAYTAVMRGWPGERIVTSDPRFAQAGYWSDPADPRTALPATDPAGVWVSGDYHLMSRTGRWDPVLRTWVQDPVGSPCVDAGDPLASIGREPLPNGGRTNLGAYGGTTQASKSLSHD
jgi:hypothetical protein